MSFWFNASYGDIPLRIQSIRTEDGKDITVQSPARGSKHFLVDRGLKPMIAVAEILFVDEPNAADYRDRFDEFRKAIASASDSSAQVFSHPVVGAYLARAQGGEHVADARGMMSWSVTFYPENAPQTVTKVLAGVSPIAGVQAVEVAAEEADQALAAAGLSSTAPTSALDKVTGWNDADDLDSQDVIVGVESLVQEINDAIDKLDTATTYEHWESYQSLVLLAYTVRRAGDALTSSTARVSSLTVDAATPLLLICTRTYGAERAPDMADKVARRNRLRTPGLVPAGTVLAMPGV